MGTGTFRVGRAGPRARARAGPFSPARSSPPPPISRSLPPPAATLPAAGNHLPAARRPPLALPPPLQAPPRRHLHLSRAPLYLVPPPAAARRRQQPHAALLLVLAPNPQSPGRPPPRAPAHQAPWPASSSRCPAIFPRNTRPCGDRLVMSTPA
nr:uncharacterized protein LOC127347687 [Lolium perenne]